MSLNKIVTKGHHTCNLGSDIEETKKNAPFISRKKELNLPYVGEGFYMWDNNINVAEWWGKCHCLDEYCIFKYDLELCGDNFLDLVGSRDDLIWFEKFVEQFITIYPCYSEYGLSKLFLLFQEFNKISKIFPISVIRIMDMSNSFFQKEKKFSENKKGLMFLDPKYIICFYEKNEIPLSTAKIVKIKKNERYKKNNGVV